MKVKIIVHIPTDNASEVREALGEAGAGKIGEYSHCSFTTKGIGRFTPTEKANPHIGGANKEEQVEEECIEVVCDKEVARHAIEQMKEVHPYEEPAFQIIPLLDELEL